MSELTKEEYSGALFVTLGFWKRDFSLNVQLTVLRVLQLFLHIIVIMI